ncbi:MAG: hypothetical protein WED07_03225 [Candidatus Freyarchaeum deiterrae]
MDKETFLIKIKSAVNTFYKKDFKLIELKVGERTLGHRVALYLEPLFEDYNVDCEYNRHGSEIKILPGISKYGGRRNTDRIYPDIVIHQRGLDSDNLAVIELKVRRKKSTSDIYDKKKLELMTRKRHGSYMYDFGLFLDFYEKEYNLTLFPDREAPFSRTIPIKR